MDNEVPENAPKSCPGTSSLAAGKTSGCAGCPNQSICSSGEASELKKINGNKIQERLKHIKNILIIVSGKGGVGKSSVTASLAYALSGPTIGKRVAVLDIDLTGPSMPQMMGCAGVEVHSSGSGWSPVYVHERLSVMSIGLMLTSQDQPVAWRDARKNNMITKMLTDVCWIEDEYDDEIDFLIVDTPPGTSGEHISLMTLLSDAGSLERTGVLFVTTPQKVAVADVERQVDFFRKLGVRLVGLVENMAEFECGNCAHRFEVWPSDGGSVAALCLRETLELAARLPLDKGVTQSLDCGRDLFHDEDDEEEETEQGQQVTRPKQTTLTLIELLANWVVTDFDKK